MKLRYFGAMLALAGCLDAPAGGLSGGGGGGGFTEQLVLGSSMSFEQCRAAGGLIIRDQGSPMVACDPSVRGEPAPVDEFNNPTHNSGT